MTDWSERVEKLKHDQEALRLGLPNTLVRDVHEAVIRELGSSLYERGVDRSQIERLVAKPVTVPEGTILTVRLKQQLGSKISTSGDSFEGSLADPISVDQKVVIPEGSDVTGTVVDAKPLGRFKGGARLEITLNSVTVKGTNYDLETTSSSKAMKGKGKRTAIMIGGGAGAGAVIGALIGGGKGAAIGAGVGAGAGTAGSAFTGNKNIVLPAETLVEFKLVKPVSVKM